VHDYKNENSLIAHCNEIYRDLTAMNSKISNFFGLTAMLGLGISFIYSIYAVFIGYKAFYENIEELKQKAILTAFWYSYLVIYPVINIVLCEMTKNYVRMTKNHYKILKNEAILFVLDQQHNEIFEQNTKCNKGRHAVP
jgi:hypothetical protein